jgi:hypothetical protein
MLVNRHQLHQACLSAGPRFACDTDVSHTDVVTESSIVDDVKRILSAVGCVLNMCSVLQNLKELFTFVVWSCPLRRK